MRSDMKMYLRNRKIKTEPIDSDDDKGPYRQYNSENCNQLMQIKLENDDDDADANAMCDIPNAGQTSLFLRSKSKLRRKSLGSVKAKSRPITKLSQPDELTMRKDAYLNNLKRCHAKKHVEPSDSPTTIQAEKLTYCCYLCGKMFKFLCRLKVHMPVHTNNRQNQCAICFKRYKSSSSLRFHINKSHSAEARKSRSRDSRSSGKKASNHPIKKTPVKRAVEMSKLQKPIKHEVFNDIKLEPLDDDVHMEWAPVGIDEYVPFVWDESDLKLILPMALIDENQLPTELNRNEHKLKELDNAVVNESCDQKNTNSSSILNVSNAENCSTTKVSPSKFAIWEKETNDPSAWYVDILQAPKSNRASFSKTANTDNIGKNGHSMKNTELAIKFRRFGDAEFSLNNLQSARQWYNRSLCHANQNTYYFSTAYAKRAQCYFREGIYHACWIDLMLAENSKSFPDALLSKLERLKQSCITMINKDGTQAAAAAQNFEPMLSFPPDPMFPEMANFVCEIECNEYFGRHIRARQSIAVGQIFIIETGFVATSTSYYEKCCVCLTDSPNLMPCSKCTQAMLCKNCDAFHQVECELQMALNLHSYPWATKVLRSFLNAIGLFETIDEMMEFVGDAISSWRAMQPVTPVVDQKSKYRAFLQLITVPTIQPALNSMVSKLHTAILGHSIIGRKFSTKKSQRFLAHLLIHHICVINAFTTKIGGVGTENGCLEIIAPITSYLKHSCAPNVSKFLLGQSIIVVAMRPIEPGEQLFASYCDILKHRADRQKFLQNEYGFVCSCERCMSPADDISWDGKPVDDQQFHAYHCKAIRDFVRHNFVHLTSNDQAKRKEITEQFQDILQRYGRMPWNYTITWAYVVFSLLLSQRFQKKLQY